MSGHSKWATIHRQKEVKDAKRGAAFTKLAAAIAVAVREGGRIGDPDKNFKLRLAIDKAKQFNMPKDNISRAIEKGMGVSGEGDLEEILFEGFLPEGCAVLLMAVTDNRARTSSQVRSYLDKHGGSLAGAGAVSYLFKPLGEVRVYVKPATQMPVDQQQLEMIDLGVEDIQLDDKEFLLYCQRDKSLELKEQLEKLGYVVSGVDLVQVPDMRVTVNDEQAQEKIEQILTDLEDMDDITHVFSNYHPG